MLSEDLKNISDQMGQFAGKVNQDDWELIKAMRMNLSSIADGVEDIEKYVFSQNLQTKEGA